jgi:hypothetical protein
MAALRSLPIALRPTIVGNISDETPGLLRLLRVSSQPNTYVPDCHGVVDVFCAKVVFANQSLRDPASAGFPLEIALPLTYEYAPLMDPRECERVAAEFQPKLLGYRLRNHTKVTNSELDLHGFTATTQETISTLAVCIVNDQELRSRVDSVLKPYDREIQVQLTTGLTAVVLDALLAQMPDRPTPPVAVDGTY